ncbi:MAG: hypothetical protein AAF483_23585 [Planctomycetota bacterium]
MSEYQYVFFAAIDKPLDDKQLDYMHDQSTRADITRWQFENEYHYGDFRGDAVEMMRRGYDVHLHYADFGVRKIMLRLPHGLPVDSATFSKYKVDLGIEWKKDAKGPGGVLIIDPEGDSSCYGEGFYDLERMADALPRIRETLIEGDPRLLYLAWLACVCSYGEEDTVIEAPVPAGLGKLPKEFDRFADFYELSLDLVKAAATASAPAPKVFDKERLIDPWLKKCSAKQLRDFVRRVIDGEGEVLRAELLALIRDEQGGAPWPLAPGGRTYAELEELADKKTLAREKSEQRAKERARKKRLDAIAADPSAAIDEANELVEARSLNNYSEAAIILAELREALGPSKGSTRADAAAKQLVKSNPTLHHLKKALKKQELNYN